MVWLMTIPVKLTNSKHTAFRMKYSNIHTNAFVADVGDCIFPLRSL